MDENQRMLKVFKELHTQANQRNSSKFIAALKAKKEFDRALAAHLLGSFNDSALLPYLSQSVQTDRSALVRKNAAFAMGQMRDSNYTAVLINALRSEIDPNTQIEILTAIGKCGGHQALTLLKQFAPETDELKHGWIRLAFHLGMSDKGWKVDSTLLSKAHQYGEDVNDESTWAYYTHWLKRLSTKRVSVNHLDVYSPPFDELESYFKFHWKVLLGDTIPPSSIAPKEGSPYASLDDFDHPYVNNQLVEAHLKDARSDPESLKSMVKELVASNDMATVSLGCYEIIKDPTKFDTASLKPILTDALNNFQKTQYHETYLDIKKALNALGEDVKGDVALIYPAIDWGYFDRLDSIERLVMTTTKGEIIMEIYPFKTPSTAVLILKEVDDHYYDGKYFHRVIPHFVAQGGCPRGDGWGSLNWLQRSHFRHDLRYETGAVGLASVGPDTEGIQFFIGLEPLPHLNGRYTVFAQVVKGVDVARQLQLGDKMLSVRRLTKQTKSM